MTQLPSTPGSFDGQILDDLPYDQSVLLLDFLARARPSRAVWCAVACRRSRSTRSPPLSARTRCVIRHVPGAAIIQATASLGFVHVYYLLGLRHREGWIGYGTHIHKAIFRQLMTPGAPVEATCVATRVRPGKDRYAIRYRFEFRGDSVRYFDGDQTAFWFRTSSA
jgi:hypothetical protein